MLIGQGDAGSYLEENVIRGLMAEALDRQDLGGSRILIIVPDGTRTAPIPLMFRLFHEIIGSRVSRLDYLIALGTHQPMAGEAIDRLVGVTAGERKRKYPNVEVHNHRWDLDEQMIRLGEIPAAEISELSGGMLNEPVSVRVNRMVLDYDMIFICGPVFPHEVVGFSGGNKYFFPGISGPEVINFSHWLGAIITSYELIGTRNTPVRRLIDRAAGFIDKPKLCFGMVVKGESLAGLYIGSPEEAWEAASELSANIHIEWVDRPYRRVLSVMPHLYDDIWTAAKGMYKLEPAIEDGGEVVIYAPHISEVSYTHGALLDEIGYHVRDYFTKQWDRFRHYPWGVIAHSTHLRGIGGYDEKTGIESPRIRVTLATRIPEERCRRINLGYLDPDSIDFNDWRDREDEGILLVPKAGEMLYRIGRKEASGKA